MILIDKPKLRFLIAGRTLELTVPRTKTFRYRTQHHYSVSTSAKKTAAFRVKVLAVTETDEGWLLKVVKAEMDTPRFLRRVGGYTTDLAQALSYAEPEPVSRLVQVKLTEQGTAKWKQELEYREAIKAGSALHDRLHDLERAHAAGEFDASRQLAAIRRRIEALEAKRRQRAA